MEIDNQKPSTKRRVCSTLSIIMIAIVTFALGVIFSSRILPRPSNASVLQHVMGLIDRYYVDTVSLRELETKVLPQVLKELDPHSVYLPAELNKKETEGLDGGFQGIGVQFITFTDTVVVTRIIEGGPSERAGLQAGDRLLRADTVLLYGKALDQERIFKALRGPAGSVVSLSIKRGTDTLELPVVRGEVPVSTLDADYMIDNKWLLVRINKWGAYTHQEFLAAYVRHRNEGIKGIIIDLRDNGGGYLMAAPMLAGEFLSKDKMIVYTEGRAYPREEFTTEQDGLLKDMPLVVLVNERSASASEIFAGAMQDHDRALIVGRRTFGKGLVQAPFLLSDSSAVRLTIARYYTPSGRSIQRSYAEGAERYGEDLSERFRHGELYSADSIVQSDSTVFLTQLGREVYGGGGIRPDVFVPLDSSGRNSYYMRLVQSGTMPRFAFEYADRNRKMLSELAATNELRPYLKQLGMGLLFEYAYYAQRAGVAIRTSMLHESAKLLQSELHAMIADHVSPSRNAFFEILMAKDLEILKATEILNKDEWRPKL
ncbi:S41 family peptidase [Porphyromonas sp. COT-239 OH1446]|uniref:S41 family peptidase n=1 Tax=Porphyromonas sp. COT-239 OH1446 TaxID=1515613 RepID=UPI00052E2448|nr:S41 family peptidase [Porphyromonas sp. COT-239 OH1446]KGN71681.1 peptidase S41 [Porphyromonas sp. COT-239 OH1446]